MVMVRGKKLPSSEGMSRLSLLLSRTPWISTNVLNGPTAVTFQKAVYVGSPKIYVKYTA